MGDTNLPVFPPNETAAASEEDGIRGQHISAAVQVRSRVWPLHGCQASLQLRVSARVQCDGAQEDTGYGPEEHLFTPQADCQGLCFTCLSSSLSKLATLSVLKTSA